jgi:hypothetical protein
MFDPFRTRNFGYFRGYDTSVRALSIGETHLPGAHARLRRQSHPGMLAVMEFSHPTAHPLQRVGNDAGVAAGAEHITAGDPDHGATEPALAA